MKTTRLITPGEIKDLACKLYPNAGHATRNRQVIAPVRAIINFAAERGLCPPIRVRNLPVPKVRRPAGDRDRLTCWKGTARVTLMLAHIILRALSSAKEIGK